MAIKTKPHHYFKIAAGSGVGKMLQGFMDKCQEADKKACAWADKQGATAYLELADGFAGGIGTLIYSTEPHIEDMEVICERDGEYYCCPKANTDLLKEMSALPVVNELELMGILALKQITTSDGRPLPMTFGKTTPPLFRYHDYWYTDVPYESTSDDCKEIKAKEFLRRRMAKMNEM